MATMAQMQRFIQAVRVDYHYFAPEGSNPLGFNEIELNTTLAIPFLRTAQTPLLITPGFTAYFWQGPNSALPPPRRPICPPIRSTLFSIWRGTRN